MIKIGLKGQEAFVAAVNKLKQAYPRAAGAVVYSIATKIMEAAVPLAPKQTGALRQSAYVTPPESGRVEFGFGVDYAPKVHEETDVRHQEGGAKFLQRAIDMVARRALQESPSVMLNAVRGGGTTPGAGKFPATPAVSGATEAPTSRKGSRLGETIRQRVRRRR